MTTFQFGSTAVRKYAETRKLEAGEVRVCIYGDGKLLFKKIGTLVKGEAWVVWLGERHKATKVAQQWRLDTEKIEEAGSAPAEDNALEWEEP